MTGLGIRTSGRSSVADRPRLPALLAAPVMECGSALYRLHIALDDLVGLTAVPAAAAMPEPGDVADVLASLATGLRQLDAVLGHLGGRLAELADSPNADTTGSHASAAGGPDDVGSVDVGGEPACRVCGCMQEAACPGGCWWVPDPLGAGRLCSTCSAAGAGAAADVVSVTLAVLAWARSGLAHTARTTAAAAGHARHLVLADPEHPPAELRLAEFPLTGPVGGPGGQEPA
jgi:hypothetical protein